MCSHINVKCVFIFLGIHKYRGGHWVEELWSKMKIRIKRDSCPHVLFVGFLKDFLVCWQQGTHKKMKRGRRKKKK